MGFVRASLVLAAALSVVQSAAAADMPVKAMPLKAFAPSFSWTGFYAGVHAGWGSNDPTGTSTVSAAGATVLTASHGLDANGPLFGGHIGYNWQINPTLVIGIEGDITGTGIKASSAQAASCLAAGNCVPPSSTPGVLTAMSQDVNWLATIRGRLGTTWWGPGMLYVTGGVAWANVDMKANAGDAATVCAGGNNNGCAFPAASNTTKTGFAVGAGYETALAGNWTVRAEYLYYNFGGETLTTAGTPAANCSFSPCTATYTFPDLNIHTVRVALTYKLGQPAGPPMAAFGLGRTAPMRSWTGAYAGVDAGWGFSDGTGTSNETKNGFPSNALTAQHDLGANGPLFGGHIGYNWQINPMLVTGIEGDITGTGIKASSAQTPLCNVNAVCSPWTGGLMTMSQQVNWLATIRGRLGTTWWGPGMLYVTGGVAWANVDYKANTGDGQFFCGLFNASCTFPAKSNTTKTGFAVGGGYETTLIGNWTVRAEYLYYSFDGETLTAAATPQAPCTNGGGGPCTATYTFPDLKIHTVRLGVSYKF